MTRIVSNPEVVERRYDDFIGIKRTGVNMKEVG